MSTQVKNAPATVVNTDLVAEIGKVIGNIVSYNTSLKLYHWHVTGPGSYSKHIALDQAIGTLSDVTDRLTETTYALKGNLRIVVTETKVPTDIIKHSEDLYAYVESKRSLFSEESFTQSIIDDYSEGIQQLLYRLKRLE